MRPEVNSNRFKSQTALKCHSVYMAICKEISLRQLSKQYQDSIAHVQMISFLSNSSKTHEHQLATLMILRNFISQRAFTIYMENSLRPKSCER